MVICKSYAEKLSCQKFKSCPDEHINVKHYVKVEMEAAVYGNQWPLSCFGPFSEKPSVPNYIEDQSFEEIRFMYYTTEKCSFIESCQKFTEALNDAKKKMQMLNAMDREVVDVLINVYDYVEPPMTVKHPLEAHFESNQGKWGVSNSSTSFRNVSKGSFPPPPPKPTLSLFPKDYDFKKFDFGFTSPPAKAVGQADEKKDNKSGVFSADAMLKADDEKDEKQSSIFDCTHLLKFQEKQDKVSGFFSSEQLQKLQANAFGSKAGQEASTQTTPQDKEECKNCEEYFKDLMTKMDAVLKTINENNEKTMEQKKTISSLSECLNQLNLGKEVGRPKYTTNPSNEPAIRIKPKFKQSSLKTKEQIKSILCPFGYFNAELQVSSMLNSAHGSIIVRCKNTASVEKIETEVVKNCAEHYSIEHVKLAMPKILVNGIDFDIDEDKLVEIIKKQNQIEGHIRLVRTFERENLHKYNAVLEVDKDVYWSIMRDSEPHLFVGWNTCIVFENIDIRRCFKCWGYNHQSRRCRNERRCPRCAGQHSEDDCTSHKLRCTNCSMANVKLNRKLDLKHDARNHHCYVYLSKLEQERKMIDY